MTEVISTTACCHSASSVCCLPWSAESSSARASSSSAASAALYQLGRLVEMLPAGLLLAVELLGLGELLLRTQLLVLLQLQRGLHQSDISIVTNERSVSPAAPPSPPPGAASACPARGWTYRSETPLSRKREWISSAR